MLSRSTPYSSTTITDDGATDTRLMVTMRDAAGAWVNSSRVTLTVTSGPGTLPGEVGELVAEHLRPDRELHAGQKVQPA